MSGWLPEDQRSWEELERRAAAQARELYARRSSSPAPPPDPGPARGEEASRQRGEPPEEIPLSTRFVPAPPRGALPPQAREEPQGQGRAPAQGVPGQGQRKASPRIAPPQPPGSNPSQGRGSAPRQGPPPREGPPPGRNPAAGRPPASGLPPSPERGAPPRYRFPGPGAASAHPSSQGIPGPAVSPGRGEAGRTGLNLGNLSSDQLLLLALLCLLVQEEADPELILAVAYVLIL